MPSPVRIIDVFTKNQAHYKSSLHFQNRREQLTEYESTGVEGKNGMASRSFYFQLALWLFPTKKMSLAALKDPEKKIVQRYFIYKIQRQ